MVSAAFCSFVTLCLVCGLARIYTPSRMSRKTCERSQTGLRFVFCITSYSSRACFDTTQFPAPLSAAQIKVADKEGIGHVEQLFNMCEERAQTWI